MLSSEQNLIKFLSNHLSISFEYIIITVLPISVYIFVLAY